MLGKDSHQSMVPEPIQPAGHLATEVRLVIEHHPPIVVLLRLGVHVALIHVHERLSEVGIHSPGREVLIRVDRHRGRVSLGKRRVLDLLELLAEPGHLQMQVRQDFLLETKIVGTRLRPVIVQRIDVDVAPVVNVLAHHARKIPSRVMGGRQTRSEGHALFVDQQLARRHCGGGRHPSGDAQAGLAATEEVLHITLVDEHDVVGRRLDGHGGHKIRRGAGREQSLQDLGRLVVVGISTRDRIRADRRTVGIGHHLRDRIPNRLAAREPRRNEVDRRDAVGIVGVVVVTFPAAREFCLVISEGKQRKRDVLPARDVGGGFLLEALRIIQLGDIQPQPVMNDRNIQVNGVSIAAPALSGY